MKPMLLALAMAAAIHPGCSEAPSKSSVESGAIPEKPRFDRCLGQTEDQVKSREGVPEYSKLLKREDLRDELRAPLRKFANKRDGNTIIKELSFRSPTRVRVYWLVKETHNWTVVRDVSFAPSVRF